MREAPGAASGYKLCAASPNYEKKSAFDNAANALGMSPELLEQSMKAYAQRKDDAHGSIEELLASKAAWETIAKMPLEDLRWIKLYFPWLIRREGKIMEEVLQWYLCR